MARRTLLLLLVGVLSIAGIAPLAASHDFTDVPDNHVFHTDIAWIAVAGITKGCNPAEGNTKYCPNDLVTRGQMAAFLDRGLDLPATSTDYFEDDNGNIFEASINRLAAAGVTKGCNPTEGNTKYCPHDYVTRGQMAAFLVRALFPGTSGPLGIFEDTGGSIFESAIGTMAIRGITKGCNPPLNTRFCPNDHVTRGQMAAFLNRALNKPPPPVTDLVATLSGGSGEIDVSWTESPHDDVVSYKVWYSFEPGATKTLLTDVYFGPSARPPDRIFITDFPRSLTSGKDCYQVSAVDAGGLEGGRSKEACFDSTPGPPSQVTGVMATTAGGSGEIAVYWNEVPELDVNDYNVWYSELPGGTETLLADPYFGPEPTTGNRWYIIDWPRSLTVGRDCYQISAVDLSGNEGSRSAEACFMP
ncbi:MAG: S-layer homology domain-containing protein [Acidimicrobiia bacterium]|nr:S-layer homology domain-containing protein [Acidimicrobiia bacterium]